MLNTKIVVVTMMITNCFVRLSITTPSVYLVAILMGGHIARYASKARPTTVIRPSWVLDTAIAQLAFNEPVFGIAVFVASAMSVRPVRARVSYLITCISVLATLVVRAWLTRPTVIGRVNIGPHDHVAMQCAAGICAARVTTLRTDPND
jgi:hypothetical protein